MEVNWLCYLVASKRKLKKTPRGEIDKAVRLMAEYYDEKEKEEKK